MPASRTTCRRKSASRKKSASRRKSASRKTCSRRRSASRSRSCAANRSRTSTGACGARAPCFDSNGNPMRFATRGADGNCRVRSCGPGMIMNPNTGKCSSRSTATGKEMALKKKYDDAKRFTAAYDAAGGSVGYYNQFDAATYLQRQQANNIKSDNLYRAQFAARSSDMAERSAANERLNRFNKSFREQTKSQGVVGRLSSMLFG